MNIEAAGLSVNENGLMDCNDHGQTAIPSIYIAGDAQLTIAAVYAMIQLKEHNFHGLVVKENAGFIKLYLNQEGIIIGGSVVGYQAKELISTIGLLIEMRTTMEQASTFYGAHPSTSETLFHGIRHSIGEEKLVL